MQEVKFELMDAGAAETLRSLLRSHGFEADGSADGPEYVAVDLIAAEHERRIESVLSIIDARRLSERPRQR